MEDKKAIVRDVFGKFYERFGFYLITPKIIISDYLFFCLVPVAEVCKVNGIISENDAYGVSSGRWLTAQKLCADVIFRRISMSKLIREWRLTQIKGVVKTIIFYRYWK